MYNNAKKQNKPNIFEIAQQIDNQVEGFKEVQQIMKAYRKVQDINLPNSNNPTKKQSSSKQENRKPQSQYANKVKQTLRQLNANRKKQAQANKNLPKLAPTQKIDGLGSAQRHLIQSGLKRAIKILNKKYDQYTKYAFSRITRIGNSIGNQIQQKIRLWKLKRIFSGWQYQAMLQKIQKQRIQKQCIQKQKKNNRLAIDFYYFCTIKQSFKNWKLQTKRAAKKRQLQFQQAIQRQEELMKMQQQKQIQKQKQNKQEQKYKLKQKLQTTQAKRKRQVQQNIALQSKIRGFLDGLKDEIQNKNKLNSIKEQNDQADHELTSQNNQNQQIQSNANTEQVNNDNENQRRQQHQGAQERHQIQNQQKGPLTNDQLQKRRKQLEKKAKQRKQALQKLKKQRQQKKKQQQQEKIALQKQIEQAQKKLRQEQYRKFLKQKKQEEEWMEKQKELTKRAIQFDRLRLMKYFGWGNWTALKSSNCQKANHIAVIMTKILLTRKLDSLISGICQLGQSKLKEAQDKMSNYYKRKLQQKCISKLKQWRANQLQLKQQLVCRHEVNMIKVFFREWQRARNLIQLQNYEWQRPRIKRAECLHAMTLMQKGLASLKINRDQQIQNRNIEEHKAKIKQKLHKIVQQKPTINYDDFL